MFSDIRNISQVKTPPPDARAEQSDTRDEIRRHDPDHERQKKKGKFKDDVRDLFGADLTEVSVETLALFLKQVLIDFTKKDEPSEQVKTSLDRNNHRSPNARAAGAYARMAQYSPVPELREKVQEAREDTSSDEITNPTLSNQDVQRVLRLQNDVAELQRKGVQTVRIEPSDNFLESLEASIKSSL